MSKWSYKRGADRGNKLSDDRWGVPRDRAELRNQTQQWAAEFNAKHSRTHSPATTIRGEIYITAGRKPDGTLRVFHFHNASEAHAAGFTWAGRPTGRA